MPFLNASSMQPAYSLRSPIDYLDDNFRFFLLLFNIVTVIIVYFFHNIHMYWSTKIIERQVYNDQLSLGFSHSDFKYPVAPFTICSSKYFSLL